MPNPEPSDPREPVSISIGRRSLLITGLAAGAMAATTGAASAGAASAGAARTGTDTRSGIRPRRLDIDPFTLGVASGDPSWDSVVLWTRLAIDPLADDGLGGMPAQLVPVQWELAHDEQFRRIVGRGTVEASPEFAHAVHVEVRGLDPARWYWYRFKAGSWISRVGRTRTAPAPNQFPRKTVMSFASCSSYPDGYFTAYRGMADDEPDLILHLGDYIYEYPAAASHVRYVYGPETQTLANYRQRYAQYKMDPDLQAAHAAAPWIATWDDHEIDNNWASDFPSYTTTPEAYEARRIAAAKAYWENMPFRQSAFPQGKSIQIYRRAGWGRLADFHMLDTRQFRADQGGGQPPLGCGDGYQADCPAASDPARSILGLDQEAWLLDGLDRSTARWNILGQQVYFGQRDSDPGAPTYVSMDAWDGYNQSRARVTQGWIDAGVRNPVVLTGDVHASWATDIKLDYQDPTGKTVGVELVATSITSGGDGFDVDPTDHPFLDWNPHLRFYNNLRGYIRTTITPDELTADYRNIGFVSQPGAETFTRASFVTYDREPGLHQTYNQPALRRSRNAAPEDLAAHTVWMETQEYK